MWVDQVPFRSHSLSWWWGFIPTPHSQRLGWFCLDWCCTGREHIITIPVRLYIQLPCCIQKILFSWSWPLPLALKNFLPSLLQSPWALVGGVQMYVPTEGCILHSLLFFAPEPAEGLCVDIFCRKKLFLGLRCTGLWRYYQLYCYKTVTFLKVINYEDMQHKEKTDREGYKKKLWVWDQPQEERVPLNDFLFKFLWMCTYCVVWVVDSCIILLTFTTTDTAQCITLNALLKEMHTLGVSQIGILRHNFTNLVVLSQQL